MSFFLRTLMRVVVLVALLKSGVSESVLMPIIGASSDPVDERMTGQQVNQPLSLLAYHPNYFFPILVSSRHSQLVTSTTPDNESLQASEVSFQLSFKIPIINHVAGADNTLYAAYTQNSFWQAYNLSPFFRETDYQPEFFISHRVDKTGYQDWQLQWVNIGLIHQSNGRGGDDERSWNRLYGQAIFSRKGWQLTIEPWYVLPDASLREHNANIADYMGHGQLLATYKRSQQYFSLTGYGLENVDQRLSGILTWSFPLNQRVNSYMQVFSGYGQSLIEYDHHVNSLGIGISLAA